MFVVPGATHNPVAGGVAFSGSGGGLISSLNALAPNPLLLLRAAGAGKDIWQAGSASGAPIVMPNMSRSPAETGTADAMDSRTTSELAAAVKCIGLYSILDHD
jgi:hypothetical protein